MTPSSVLGTILAQAQVGNVITLADLAPVRDYCFVDDAAFAVVAASQHVQEQMSVMNLATGTGTSVRELAQSVGRVLHRTFDIRERDTEHRPPTMQIQRLVGDNTKIRTALQWMPCHDLLQGLNKTIEALAIA
jgi:UDP-glucose 4-epimerase